ncbi:hypothetical protein JCM17960_16040 [Magnetospira thiophila]
MKFLMFNLVVGGALVYLMVFGGPTGLPLTREMFPDRPQKIVAQQIEVPAPTPEPQPAPQVAALPPAPVVPAVQAPPPLPEPIPVVTRTVQPAPKGDSPGHAPVAVSEPEVPKTDPTERRRALQDLVSDMERLYAEKMTR